MKKKSDLVTQDNALINASYTLDLIEKRLILLAIAKKRQMVKCETSNHIEIRAKDYEKSFQVDSSTAYQSLKSASKNLFDRYFSYQTIDRRGKLGLTNSRWVSEATYFDSEGYLSLVFSPSVLTFITELEKRFTSYFLSDISKLTSIYAVRLYELIIAWKVTHKTPIFELEDFRKKMGVKEDEYPRMTNFKQRVLDIAINQINEHSNIRIECEQHKKGRKITGFSFSFVELVEEPKRDPNTIDWVDQEQKTKREKLTINEIVCRHPNETIGKSEPEIYKMYGSKYHII